MKLLASPRRPFIEAKIAKLDERIDNHLNRNEFLEAQELENQLRFYENQLLKTYTQNELYNLYSEGFPNIGA